jgi:2-polyprenyl-3-methyl-5-hydroxy-6-metoxy-1,4-benzoquinol methylase
MESRYNCAPVCTPDTIVWEEIRCPLCNAADEELFLQAPAEPRNTLYRLVRCRCCQMVYMNPRPDARSISQFYPDDYEAYRAPRPKGTGWWSRARSYLEQLIRSRSYGYPPALQTWRERLLAWLATPWFGPDHNSQTTLPFVGQGRLLDYGCGAGHFLARMRQRGWTVHGMDFSVRAAEQAARWHNLQVVVGTLPHPAIRPASYDLITIGAVLEHVHCPHQVIAAAGEALRPGGLLVVAVPNLDSWGFRHFGEDWWGLELPRHLLHFTPDTLRRLLEEHGLQVQELRMQARASWMRRSFDRAGRAERPLPRRLLSKLGKLRLVPSLLTRYSAWTRQTDSMVAIASRPPAAEKRSLLAAAWGARTANPRGAWLLRSSGPILPESQAAAAPHPGDTPCAACSVPSFSACPASLPINQPPFPEPNR